MNPTQLITLLAYIDAAIAAAIAKHRVGDEEGWGDYVPNLEAEMRSIRRGLWMAMTGKPIPAEEDRR